MDTLEFFYVTADKNVCGKTYYSSTSDTVGYYLMDVKRNESGTSLEMYPLYFDMREQGIVTTEDFLGKNMDLLSSVTTWVYETQSWLAATTFYDPKADDPETTDPVEFYDAFDMPYNSVLYIAIVKEGQLLQYGKLPKPIHFNLQGAATGSSRFTIAFVQPWRLDLKQSSDAIMDLDLKISTMDTWNFASQVFNAATSFYNPKDDDPDSTDPVEWYDEFPLKGLLPIRVANGTESDVKW